MVAACLNVRSLSRLRTFLTILASWSLANIVWGCNVPVFRYALERWQPDFYEVVVFYDQELSPAEQAIVASLQQGGSSTQHPPCNINALTADVNKLQEKWLIDLWQQQRDEPLPRSVVLSPHRRSKGEVVWSGPLAKLDLPKLHDSPARRELAQRLLAGDAIVWLVVAGQQTKGAEHAEARLREQLQRQQKEIQLPPGIGETGSELLTKIPLAIRFSQLRVDASDPAEEMFVATLLAQRTKPTLDQPLVIPVFGQGRGLDAIKADELTAEIIQDMCKFLCAACSCRVKEQNPGFDLLLAVAWQPGETLVAGIEERDLLSEPQTLAIPPGNSRALATEPPATNPTTSSRSNEWWLVVVLSVAVCLALFLLPAGRLSSTHS